MCRVHGPFARCECGYARGAKTGGFLVALALAGCLPAKVPAVDPCSAEIVKLEGERDAEILAACAGQAFDACPAVAALNAKYDPFIQAQVRCDQ